ncbi:MAG: hypothetical protein R2713_03185 [Ilumatobacteraceae bacterium]
MSGIGKVPANGDHLRIARIDRRFDCDPQDFGRSYINFIRERSAIVVVNAVQRHGQQHRNRRVAQVAGRQRA